VHVHSYHQIPAQLAVVEAISILWWRVLFMFLALVAIAIVKAVPFIGGVIVLLLFIAGIGAFTMRSWAGFRRDAAEAAV
jgi:hypothetical protein